MKKISVLSAVTFLLLCMAACSSSDDEKVTNIVVNNQHELQQVVDADDTKGESTISFTTTDAWHSTIKEHNTTRGNSTKGISWISISPESGDKAGKYNISITLTPNETDTDRSATISIICGNQEIKISISQKGTSKEETEKPEKPQPEAKGIVKKINGESIVYQDLGDILIASQIGTTSYLGKPYSPTQWVYLEGDGKWRCDYEYGQSGHLTKTIWCPDFMQSSAGFITECYWDNQMLSYLRGDQMAVSRDGYLRTNLTYGSTQYTLGNIDINWLLASNQYYTEVPASAIGIKTTKNESLLTKKTQIEEKGDGKYNYIYTYRYVFNEAGYITGIYETTEHAIYKDIKPQEQLIYTFEY